MTAAAPIEARSARVVCAGRAILDGVTLRLEAGLVWGVIGPSGAGKSTLLRALAGLIELDAGAITLGGRPLPAIGRRALALERAYLGPGAPDALGYSALETVMMGEHALGAGLGFGGPQARLRAERCLARAGVADLGPRPLSRLSSGEAQRVQIARTLAQRAPWWLLDEPTANLDLGHALAALALATEHARSGGGVVVALHDLNLTQGSCDRVVAMRAGAIVGAGAPEAIMTEASLSSLYDAEVRAAPGAGGRPVWYALAPSRAR